MLCKKDFKRLHKLMTLNMGEGHFMDDSDEFDSDHEKSRFRKKHQAEAEDDDQQ